MTGDPHDERLAMWIELALDAEQHRQTTATTRLLLIATEAAAVAGRLVVAEELRDLILAHAPHHLVGKSPTAAAALRQDDVQSLLRQAHREVPIERAERWLDRLLTRRLPKDVTTRPATVRWLES